MKTSRWSLFLFAVIALTIPRGLSAYRIAQFNGTPASGWSDGNIVMQLQLGNTGGGILIDGETAWGPVAESALFIWNEVLGRAQFRVVRDSTIPRVFGDGKNSVYFDSTTPFGSFGSNTVAVTVITTSGSDQHITEADVIFNRNVSYNSYRGPLKTASQGGTLNDLRRVALREFGRVLGLDYPDLGSAPQRVTAQMNFHPSNLDTLAQDDVNGAQHLYEPPASLSRLANVSARLKVQSGDNVLIGGVIIEGPTPKKVIFRAIGPSLAALAVPGSLQDPVLELHDANGTQVDYNNNWQDKQAAAIQATGIAPTDPRESAIVATLPPAGYTAIIRGANNTTGVALVEMYELDPDSSTVLANISTRGRVETGANVLIGGFIVNGTSAQRVIVRAIGPTLSASRVAGVLSDPILELHDASQNVIVTNNNWKDTQQSEITQTGLAPKDDRESAIVATLAPGNYTAVVRGVNNSVGVALVEVYRLQQTSLPVRISLSITSVALPPGGTKSFGVGLDGTDHTGVIWSVNGIPGGNSAVGTISSSGVYHAPATPLAAPITINVRSVADPGVSASAAIAVGYGVVAPSIYAGTYFGQFNVKYHYDAGPVGQQPVTVHGNRSFNITIELKTIIAGVNGVDVLRVSKVTCSDSFFDAKFGIVPALGSVATLPNPPANISTQDGEGIAILFPNKAALATYNYGGALHVSSDARLLSNSLDPAVSTQAWSAIKADPSLPLDDREYLTHSDPAAAAHASTLVIDEKTWALTKSAF